MSQNFVFEVRDAANIDKTVKLDSSEFLSFKISTINQDESNAFLNTLWNVMDSRISPEGKEYCPWAFVPAKISEHGKQLTYFGSVRTLVCFYHIAVTYTKKGSIDCILIKPYGYKGEESVINELTKNLIDDALKNMLNRIEYIMKGEISGRFENQQISYPLYDYYGSNFSIETENEKSFIKFATTGVDLHSAFNNAVDRIEKISDFLSVETNTVVTIENLEIFTSNGVEKGTQILGTFQNQFKWHNEEDNAKFIDFCPLQDGKLLLSKEAIQIVAQVLDYEAEIEDELSVFLKGCYHFSNSLRHESVSHGDMIELGEVMYLKKSSGVKRETSILDNAVTGYLSAIETVSLNDAIVDKCTECGQQKFGITQRVNDFIEHNLWEGYGRIFKKIYHVRSLYLHTGESCSKSVAGPVRPLIDKNTGTGAVDYGFLSLNIEGKNFGVGLNNLREWTSYSLRNYYKSKFCTPC